MANTCNTITFTMQKKSQFALWNLHVTQASWLRKWKLQGSPKSIKKNKNCHQLVAAYKVRVTCPVCVHMLCFTFAAKGGFTLPYARQPCVKGWWGCTFLLCTALSYITLCTCTLTYIHVVSGLQDIFKFVRAIYIVAFYIHIHIRTCASGWLWIHVLKRLPVFLCCVLLSMYTTAWLVHWLTRAKE